MSTKSSWTNSNLRLRNGEVFEKESKENYLQITPPTSPPQRGAPLSSELPRLALLVFLYLLQGVPLGLVFGTIPFLLKSSLSYSDLAVFSVAGYPYSLKLLWSPFVDSVYLSRIGRRKTWIIPTQAVLGFIFLHLSGNIETLFYKEANIYSITLVWTLVVFCSATQDIAVDGWALTLLSKENLSYASTCQTIGLNCGYFLSFTVFLAFNSAEFCNSWLRSTPSEAPLLELSSYLFLWGVLYLFCTALLLLGIQEDDELLHEEELSSREVYQQIWKVIHLPAMKQMLLLLLIHKIGFICNDTATGLKLLERGFKKEDLALTVLIDFPFQIFLGVYVASWSSGIRPLRPFYSAILGRLFMAFVGMAIVYYYPVDAHVSSLYFVLIVASTLASSCMSTAMFVSQGAFFARIGDPAIGGTYLTLLNTFSNFGGTWPKYFVLKLIDSFSSSVCVQAAHYEHLLEQLTTSPDAAFYSDYLVSGDFSCITDDSKHACEAVSGKCLQISDGYFIVALGSSLGGLFITVFLVKRLCNFLERVPEQNWRVKA